MPTRKVRAAMPAFALLVLGVPFTAVTAISVTCQYDIRGRVSRTVYVNGATTRTVTYTYDAADNWSSVVSH